MTEVFEVAQAVLLSVGGGGLIILALSSWLGKIWASRILETDRNKYAREMESIRQVNKSVSDALKMASSTHSESVRIYAELRCDAVTKLWKEFLRIKKSTPLSLFFIDMVPSGKKVSEVLSAHAMQEIKQEFSETQKSLLHLSSDDIAPYLDERHLELLLLYRKAIFRIHSCYETLVQNGSENKDTWRVDELLSGHFKLVFGEDALLTMQNEKWTTGFLLTFIEKHLISELRNAVTGESNSKKILDQSMKNIKLISELDALENRGKS